MIPWGAIIGLAGQAVSGIASAVNNRRQQASADAEAARHEAVYEAKANEDPLARSENQRLLNQYNREAQRQVERARNMATITGATPEQAAAVQKGIANGRANLMGDMAADASYRKDRYEQMAENVRHQKSLDDQARLAARQQTYANLAANAASAVGGIMDSYSAKIPESQPSSQAEGNSAKLASSTDASKPMSERYQAAADMAGKNTPEGQVLSTTAQAAANKEKLATAQPQPAQPSNPYQGAPYDETNKPWMVR